jgi:hypothetical protein
MLVRSVEIPLCIDAHRDATILLPSPLQKEPPYPRYFSRELRSLLKGLLTKIPHKRLGAGPRDAKAIKVGAIPS